MIKRTQETKDANYDAMKERFAAGKPAVPRGRPKSPVERTQRCTIVISQSERASLDWIKYKTHRDFTTVLRRGLALAIAEIEAEHSVTVPKNSENERENSETNEIS